MKIISSSALDRFFFCIAHKAREIKEQIKPQQFGDMFYYDCDAVLLLLPIKAKKQFIAFLDRNYMEVHEITVTSH